eukprot:400850-Pyramimonas_sp.AAC.1
MLRHTRIHARRFARTQIHSQSDALALSLPTYSDQSFSCRHTPSTARCLIGITAEHVDHNCGIHTCICLGPSSG